MPSRHTLLKNFIPPAPYLIIALIIFIGAISGLVVLTDQVLEGDILAVDVNLLKLINQISTAALDKLSIVTTRLGDTLFVMGVALIAVLSFIKKRKYHAAIFLFSSVLGSVIISRSLKALFARPRPEHLQALVDVSSFSFPSGHAIASSALALSLGLILWRTHLRWVATISGAAYVLLIGFSRLYLGVHYPSDVVAGWLVSTCWVLVVAGVILMNKHIALSKPDHKSLNKHKQ